MSKATTKRGLPRRRVSPGASAVDRIMLHTDRSGACWIWLGSVDKSSGYGRLSMGGRSLYAHRVSYEAFVRPIPPGAQVDHLCRVRACCNPAHLEAVTAEENVRRGESPGAIARRRSACLYGVHQYEESARWYEGRRTCRECARTYSRLYKKVPYAEAMRRKAAGEPVVDLAAHFAETRVA